VRNKVDGGAIPRGLPGATTADRGGPASLAWPLAGVAAFAILTAVGARLVVFREPVPVTLQVYFVLAAGMVLGSRMGALSQLAYLGLGLSGVPVFAAPRTPASAASWVPPEATWWALSPPPTLPGSA